MLSKTYTFGLLGLDAYPITIEVDVTKGLPSTTIVGLPDNAIRESKQRVRSAIKNSGFKFDPKRITINLAPADIKKEGPSFDLAIALGILAATEQINPDYLSQFAICAELSLDGNLQPVRGALTIAHAIKKTNLTGLILPYKNMAEVSVLKDIPLFLVRNLNDAAAILTNPILFKPFKPTERILNRKSSYDDVDFSDVKGQYHIKRGLEIAAAGAHNALLMGPPGSGKSMLAKRFPTILPEMTFDEAIETTQIHSATGERMAGSGLMADRPFRSPHHTTSNVALVGGGSQPKAGEVTLSHHGVLFLDELPEFSRSALEALRQPLEDRKVTIARANSSLKFPANFILIAAMNPCPCGWYTDQKKKCKCHPNQIHRYISKISGPLLDRIDLHLQVPSVESSDLFNNLKGESSETIRIRTTMARKVQHDRFSKLRIFANAQMNHRHLNKYCSLSKECVDLLKKAIEGLGLSARAHDKVIKIARTIADLEEKNNIEEDHIAEAIQARSLDRGWWG